MSCLSTTDQGQPVNHHLEVHIFSKSIGVYSASGTEVKDIVPVVAITDHATGNSRDLADLTACLSASQVDYPYFGDNVYLPDGTYSATVGVADETAVFESVAVKSDGP